MPRKRRSHSITLEQQEDGTYAFPVGSFDRAAGQSINLAFPGTPGRLRGASVDPGSPGAKEYARELGLPIGPDRGLHFLPPIPGVLGRWRGKGTARDPKHWVGLSEAEAKVLAYAIAAGLVIWGVESVAIDASNWWQNSSLNVANDLTKLGATALGALGIPFTTATDANGKPYVATTTPRQHATFFSWFFNQVALQGGDLQQAVNSINGLAVGLNSGPPSLPAGQYFGPPGNPNTTTGPTSYNPVNGPGDTSTSSAPGNCALNYSLMYFQRNGVTLYLCVRSDWIPYEQANGWTLGTPPITPPGSGGTGNTGGGTTTPPPGMPNQIAPNAAGACPVGYTLNLNLGQTNVVGYAQNYCQKNGTSGS